MCPNKKISGRQRKEEIADAKSGVTCPTFSIEPYNSPTFKAKIKLEMT